VYGRSYPNPSLLYTLDTLTLACGASHLTLPCTLSFPCRDDMWHAPLDISLTLGTTLTLMRLGFLFTTNETILCLQNLQFLTGNQVCQHFELY